MQPLFFSSVRREKGVSSQAFLTETVETGDKNRDDFHCMQMSLVMSMRFIFDTDMTHVSWTRFGNDVIFPESRGPWFSCNYARVLKSKYPEQGEKILLQCIEALRFSEYCGNYWNSTVKSIHFVVVVKMWNCVALYKSLRYQWFLTFEYYWKQLQLRLTLRLCHGCGHTGSFVLDYHTVYLRHFMSTE